MKKLNNEKEFERMQKLYENSTGIHSRMDLLAFAQNYYDGLLRKFQELRNFWTPEELAKFLQTLITQEV